MSTMSSADRAKVEAEPCRCKRCSACDGAGTIWVDFAGRFLGNRRSDDLDQLEPCEECYGGIREVCDRCQVLEEDDYD